MTNVISFVCTKQRRKCMETKVQINKRAKTEVMVCGAKYIWSWEQVRADTLTYVDNNLQHKGFLRSVEIQNDFRQLRARWLRFRLTCCAPVHIQYEVVSITTDCLTFELTFGEVRLMYLLCDLETTDFIWFLTAHIRTREKNAAHPIKRTIEMSQSKCGCSHCRSVDRIPYNL